MTERTSKIRRIAIVALVVAVVASVAVAYFSAAPSEYLLLDSRLGDSGRQPTNLLAVLSWEYHPNNQNPFALGHPEFSDFKHLALLRLLDIQREQFGRTPPTRATGGTYIDHSFVRVTERTNSRVVVLGTGTLKPVHFDRSSIHGPDPYWQMERFTFALDGQLLSRESYTQ